MDILDKIDEALLRIAATLDDLSVDVESYNAEHAEKILEAARDLENLHEQTVHVEMHRLEARRCGSCSWWDEEKKACLNPEGPVQGKTSGRRNGSCVLWNPLDEQSDYIQE